MNARFGILLTGALVLAGESASADCGGIPFKPSVQIFEPNQRAVIGFNGREEILLLSTDLRASESTKVLQVLPLPSEPKVTKGDFDLFVKATDLINARLAPRGLGGAGGMGAMGSGGAPGRAPLPAGKVTFHDKIGSHEISVTRVLHQRGFIDWVDNYLRKAGVDNPTIPEAMKEVVAEYLRQGFRWFVFDVIELADEVKTKEAIQYRFFTRSLYYPLRITRTEEGDTEVRLLILSPKLLPLPKVGKTRVRVAHQPIQISPQELRSLGNDEMAALMNRQSCMLRIWEVKGPLSGFKKDIVTSSPQ